MTKFQRYNLKNPPVAFRLDPISKEALSKASKKENISVASLIFKIVKSWLIENGYIRVHEEVI